MQTHMQKRWSVKEAELSMLCGLGASNINTLIMQG